MTKEQRDLNTQKAIQTFKKARHILKVPQSDTYHYSKDEIGKDHSINPNYYADEGLGSHNAMLLQHLVKIFPKSYSVGFLIFTIIKYLKRFPQKGHMEDIRKAQTNLKFLIGILKGSTNFKK